MRPFHHETDQYNQPISLIDYFKIASDRVKVINNHSKTIKSDDFKIISDHFNVIIHRFKTENVYQASPIRMISLTPSH